MNRRAFAALVRKDVLLELRGSEVVLGMLTFVVAAFVLFRFGLGGGRPAGGTRAATGMLWVAIVFTAMLGLSRTFAQEREHGIWDGLLAAPIDRALVWLARSCSTCLFLMAVQVVALPAFWLFFLQSGPAPDYAVLVAARLAGGCRHRCAGDAGRGAGLGGTRPRGAPARPLPALCDPACAGCGERDHRHDFPANKRFTHG